MWNIDLWPFWQAQEAALVEGWHLSICLAGLPSCLTPLQSILFAPHLIQTAKAHHLHHHLQIQTQCIKVVILRNWWVIGWVAVTSSWLAENGRCDQWVDHFCMPAVCLKGHWSKQQGREGRERGERGGHCGPGSNPRIDTTHGLSLLLVLSHASRGFSLGTLVFVSPQKVTFLNSNLTRNQLLDKKTTKWMCYL